MDITCSVLQHGRFCMLNKLFQRRLRGRTLKNAMAGGVDHAHRSNALLLRRRLRHPLLSLRRRARSTPQEDISWRPTSSPSPGTRGAEGKREKEKGRLRARWPGHRLWGWVRCAVRGGKQEMRSNQSLVTRTDTNGRQPITHLTHAHSCQCCAKYHPLWITRDIIRTTEKESSFWL